MKKTYILYIGLLVLLLMAACTSEPDQTPAPAITTGEIGQAIVDSLEVQQLAGENSAYQVVVRGHLTNTCTQISGAAAEFDVDEFTVSIETELLDEVNCLEESLAFERVISLDVESLADGEFSVAAGNLSETFELASASGTTTASTPTEPTPVTPTSTAAITGVVWHDECINQTEGEWDRSGCLESSDVFIGDGDQGENEAGIEAVRVDLGEGACPTTGLANAVTTSDGAFEFTGLEAGVYCVSVNPAIPENQGPLGDGVWTAPEDSSGSITVDLTEDAEASAVALGWDYLNQPEFVSGAEPEPDCVSRAAYYGDVTIPDDTVMEPGETFVKKWRIRNEGTCTWGPGYEVVFGNGDVMGGVATPLPAAEPGDTVEVEVELTAPEESGYYRGNWGFHDPHGRLFSVGASGTTPIWVQIVVSFFSGGSPDVPAGTPTCGEDLDSEFITELLERVNAERTRRGLPPLRLQEQLSAAAQGHSSDMACNDFLSHSGSGGTTYSNRVRAQGYSGFSYLTENIYAGNPSYGGTPEGAVEWWMNSQVHRDAILHPTVTEIGIGYAFYQNSNYGAYYTLVFAQPTS